MELAARSLSDVRAYSFNEITDSRRQRWLVEIGRSLSWLHNLKPIIVHGDLRPANIMLSEFDEIKLIDFGLSQIVTAKPLGNSHIRLQGEDGSHPSCDVFAFGIVAFQLYHQFALPIVSAEGASLQGWQDVFEKNSCAQQVMALLAAELPVQVADVIQACLCPNPGLRPTASELIDILRTNLCAPEKERLRSRAMVEEQS